MRKLITACLAGQVGAVDKAASGGLAEIQAAQMARAFTNTSMQQ